MADEYIQLINDCLLLWEHVAVVDISTEKGEDMDFASYCEKLEKLTDCTILNRDDYMDLPTLSDLQIFAKMVTYMKKEDFLSKHLDKGQLHIVPKLPNFNILSSIRKRTNKIRSNIINNVMKETKDILKYNRNTHKEIIWDIYNIWTILLNILPELKDNTIAISMYNAIKDLYLHYDYDRIKEFNIRNSIGLLNLLTENTVYTISQLETSDPKDYREALFHIEDFWHTYIDDGMKLSEYHYTLYQSVRAYIGILDLAQYTYDILTRNPENHHLNTLFDIKNRWYMYKKDGIQLSIIYYNWVSNRIKRYG